MNTNSTQWTLERVREQVEQVLKLDLGDGDPETAHCEQDEAYEAVLRAVAAGHPQAQQMAVECLRMMESGGTRWYA